MGLTWFPVVKNLPANAGNIGVISLSNKTQHAMEQLNPCATTSEPMHHNS